MTERLAEARIDLHTHTVHSEDRERIALPHGASVIVPFNPTLTPLEAYDLALARGMTHVTFTDHDTLAGGLELLERHPNPERFILGEEVTCYHLGRPVHVGVYGLTESHHARIHAGSERTDREARCLRWNIAELVAFCEAEGLLYDLKHPVWSADGAVPTRRWLSELLAIFPRVEAINGTRHRTQNELGVRLALKVGRGDVAFTAGSDSHTDNIGTVYTVTAGTTVDEVLESLRAGDSRPVGPHGSHDLLDYDFRAILLANFNRRAGYAVALADDFVRELPFMAREVAAMALSGWVVFSVVNEFARQRALAAAIEELFDGDLRGESPGLKDAVDARTAPLAAPTGRAVY